VGSVVVGSVVVGPGVVLAVALVVVAPVVEPKVVLVVVLVVVPKVVQVATVIVTPTMTPRALIPTAVVSQKPEPMVQTLHRHIPLKTQTLLPTTLLLLQVSPNPVFQREVQTQGTITPLLLPLEVTLELVVVLGIVVRITNQAITMLEITTVVISLVGTFWVVTS
jgi:hypothetical protein